MSSLRSFKSISATAVNFLPFHGHQPGPVKRCCWEERPRGEGGRGEPEGRAVPHTQTCSFSHQNTVSLLPLSLFVIITHKHFLPPLSSHPISLVTFSLFAPFLSYTLTHAAVASEEDHMVSWVRRRLHIPGNLAVGLQGLWPRSSKSHPSFPLISERTSGKFPENERKKKSQDQRNEGQWS